MGRSIVNKLISKLSQQILVNKLRNFFTIKKNVK
jgi:hypothetical protein